MKPIPVFPGSDRLVSHFGYWPRFHDAHLISCKLAENGTHRHLDLLIHAFSMTKEVDANGYFVLQRHCLVNFHFHDVEPLDLNGFTTSNILFDLELNQSEKNWIVNVSMVIDRDLEFTCSCPEVVSLALCDSKGKKI